MVFPLIFYTKNMCRRMRQLPGKPSAMCHSEIRFKAGIITMSSDVTRMAAQRFAAAAKTTICAFSWGIKYSITHAIIANSEPSPEHQISPPATIGRYRRNTL